MPKFGSFTDATHDFGFGDLFGGGHTVAESIQRRLNQYDRRYGTGHKSLEHITKRLNYFAGSLEKRIARRTEKGKGDTDKTKRLQSMLDAIYSRLRPPGDMDPNGNLSRGAARENAEGRAATIYLGGYSSQLGIQAPTPPAVPTVPGGGTGTGRGVGRPNRGPARSFLGQYYSGGQVGGRDRNRLP